MTTGSGEIAVLGGMVDRPTGGPAMIRAPGVSMLMPALIVDAGEDAARFTIEFFLARIPNRNTRAAYGRAVGRFCRWCEDRGVSFKGVTASLVAAYLESLQQDGLGIPSVKLQLAALRHWLDWLTQNGVLPANPAAAVRGPKLVVREGKTPVLERDQARALFDSIAGDDLGSKRDRALLAVMLFQFVRVGAVVKMRVRDFEDSGGDAVLVVHEKGGKVRRIPCHHRAREYLRDYVAAAGFTDPRDKAPLFQSSPRRGAALSGLALDRRNAWDMVKRRCAAAGLPAAISNHSFRGTGITLHLENNGALEAAQNLAGHADIRTTQLYDRRSRKIQRAEVERVQL
jgi:site-specific recombinase XerD